MYVLLNDGLSNFQAHLHLNFILQASAGWGKLKEVEDPDGILFLSLSGMLSDWCARDDMWQDVWGKVSDPLRCPEL